jgi:hypothetical protein
LCCVFLGFVPLDLSAVCHGGDRHGHAERPSENDRLGEDIGASTLGHWVSAAREDGSGSSSPMTPTERDRELQMRVDLLKKAG